MANQEFKANVKLEEGLFVEADVRGFKVNMDEPEQLGGTNKAMNPVELLLCSLGGCLLISITAFSKELQIELKDCQVEVTGDLDPDGFFGKNKDVRVGFSQIRYNLEIVTDAPDEKIEKLFQLLKERCPVSDTLKGVEVVQNYKVTK
ncbi:peroxiredoxin [Vulcanibacillus modesticaldus]|uniref:Peroxiredoxin n=1 Tax=Vulcanibacillus modesticaldus TaxID=337097 RepID=A0A1D2YTR9_9BACI|nr:OsmC family protein [Vulcanibacillus modesticaldus]OEF99051.1 peroxiredoxin [Vulcanibacillus modesticaldus]